MPTTIRAARRWTLYSSTQNVHGVRQTLAHQILHVPESHIRVVARDVGGGFGMKGNVYPEEAVRRLGGAPGRPAGQMDPDALRGVARRL